MSPYLHYEIARARQQEIVSRTINAHHHDAPRAAGRRYRGIKHRLVQVIATLAVLVAAGTAVTVSDAHSSQAPVKQQAVRVSAQRLTREIRALEAKGYVPTACTVSGTLMRNYKTGQSVLVEWHAAAHHLAVS